MTKAITVWWIGNIISIVICISLWTNHGAAIALPVGYIISLLIDIRYELEKRNQQ